MFQKYSSESPSRKKPMTADFAFSCPAHIIASFCGSGVLTPAPGTWGTLAGFLVYLALQTVLSPLVLAVLTIACFFVGAWACGVTGRDIGVHDHGSIVIDEVFAIWMVLLCLPSGFCWQLAGFFAFRLFDIIKLPPAKWFDQGEKWQNGWGVMLDDLIAGLYAIILVQGIHLCIG